MGNIVLATPPQRRDRASGPTTPSRHPDGPRRSGHVSTASTQRPDNQPFPHRSQMGPRGPATPSQWRDGVQMASHAPTAANIAELTSRAHTTTKRGLGDWARLHGCQTRLRGPPTPPRQPDGSQKTGHTHTAAKQSPGDRTCLHSGQKGPRELAIFPRRPDGAQATFHAPTAAIFVQRIGHAPWVARWNQEVGHTPRAARRNPGDQLRPQVGQTGLRGPATLPRQPDKT